ncbi:unnamed protein product [Brassica oleracea var. botrytis]
MVKRKHDIGILIVIGDLANDDKANDVTTVRHSPPLFPVNVCLCFPHYYAFTLTSSLPRVTRYNNNNDCTNLNSVLPGNGVAKGVVGQSLMFLLLINCVLKAGAQPNQKDEEGNRLLEIAALRENIKIFETLFPLTTKPETVSAWTFGNSNKKSGETVTKKDLLEDKLTMPYLMPKSAEN